MNIQDVLSELITIIGALVIVVNIITEVFKKVFEFHSEKITNVFVLGCSEFLTFFTFFAYMKIHDMSISYLTGVAVLVVGLLVAYAAMFGFDKLLKHLESLLKGKNNEL